MSGIIDIESIGRGAIVSTDDIAWTFEATDNPREFKNEERTNNSLDWTERSYTTGGWTIFPYGDNDNLPKDIMDVVQKNYIAPGVLKKKTQLLWGTQPALYKQSIVGGKIVKEWVEDAEIEAWLETWDYQKYLYNCTVDFHHLEATNTKFIRSKGYRVGANPMISELEHISPVHPRLAKRSNDKGSKPTHSAYKLNSIERQQFNSEYKVYPLFDFKDPFKHPNAILHSNLYSFCSDYHTVPDIFGTLEWLRISTTVTIILTALSKNSINVKYHISSPQKFWDMKESQLREAATDTNPYTDQTLISYRDNVLREITKVLSGAKNVGKFWHSIKYYEIDGMKIFEHGWEIKEIKQNIKEFISAQETVSNISGRSIGAAMGVHQSIGGSSEKGKTDSGGEQLYALKTFLATGIAIPEMVICKGMNNAIKANWPKSKVKMGFHHIATQKEEEIHSGDRFKDNV